MPYAWTTVCVEPSLRGCDNPALSIFVDPWCRQKIHWDIRIALAPPPASVRECT